MDGPLRILASNPRHFTDGSGKPIFFAGSHTWENDNVLYEVGNEAGSYPTEWQYHIIDFVKRYEAEIPKQRPVGMAFQYKGGTDATLYDGRADWVSPSAALPPEAAGNKVIINDTDHSFGPIDLRSVGHSDQIACAWENLACGKHLGLHGFYLWVWPGRNAPKGDNVDPYREEIRWSGAGPPWPVRAPNISFSSLLPKGASIGS
jgi:hypothetical protein